MDVVIRRWTHVAALAEALQQREDEVRELLQGVPGFVAYYAMRDGDTVTTMTVCTDREGTRESTRRAREWTQRNLADAGIGSPEIIEGETFLQF
jgi:hypothetical protein